MFPADNKKVDYHVKRFLMGPWRNLDGSWMLPVVDRYGNPDHEPRGIIGVIGEPGGPPRTLEAVVLLGVGSYWYTRTIHLEEYIMFVDPAHRKGKHHAHSLIEWQKWQAEINGMQLVTGILSNDLSYQKCRLLSRQLHRAGQFFTWPANYESDKLSGLGRTSKRRSLSRFVEAMKHEVVN
jgi:hypothetical protein